MRKMALPLTNSRIYTVDPTLPWAEAALIEGPSSPLVRTEEEVRAGVPADADPVARSHQGEEQS
jgi:hypothetical protein